MYQHNEAVGFVTGSTSEWIACYDLSGRGVVTPRPGETRRGVFATDHPIRVDAGLVRAATSKEADAFRAMGMQLLRQHGVKAERAAEARILHEVLIVRLRDGGDVLVGGVAAKDSSVGPWDVTTSALIFAEWEAGSLTPLHIVRLATLEARRLSRMLTRRRWTTRVT